MELLHYSKETPHILHPCCSHSDQWTETQQITVVEHNLLSRQNTCKPAGATMPSLCYNNCIVLCSCRGSKQSKKNLEQMLFLSFRLLLL